MTDTLAFWKWGEYFRRIGQIKISIQATSTGNGANTAVCKSKSLSNRKRNQLHTARPAMPKKIIFGQSERFVIKEK